MPTGAPSLCVTCGSELAGEYCHACGERAHREPPTLLRFVGELIGEALDADGRIVKSIRTLIARPGRLTVEYIQGRRKPYLGPAAIFVVSNVLFFFVQPLANVNTFHATLYSQTNWYRYSEWALLYRAPGFRDTFLCRAVAVHGRDQHGYLGLLAA